MAQEDMKQLVDGLFKAVDINTFNGADILTYYPNFNEKTAIRELLQYFRTHGGTRIADIFPENEPPTPFMGQFISSCIDFDRKDLSEGDTTEEDWQNQVLSEDNETHWWEVPHDENSPDKFWNESVEKLNQDLIKFYNRDSSTGNYQITDWATISDVTKTDAGNSFVTIDNCVVPWKNADQKDYSDVRSDDKLETALLNHEDLQFTRSKEYQDFVNFYLRLLMPAYTRVVQVEDLNRNFWVIAQVIGEICEYLFGTDSSLNNFLKSLLDEVTQLWENVLYLWKLAQYVNDKEVIKDIKVIFMPFTDKDHDYVKFDNFERYLNNVPVDLQNVMDHAQFLIDMYGDVNLIIIPEIRHVGYYKNYYAAALYPGIIAWNANMKKKSFTRIYIGNPSKDKSVPNGDPLKWENTSGEDFDYKTWIEHIALINLCMEQRLTHTSDNGGKTYFQPTLNEPGEFTYIRPSVEVAAHVTEIPGYGAWLRLTGFRINLIDTNMPRRDKGEKHDIQKDENGKPKINYSYFEFTGVWNLDDHSTATESLPTTPLPMWIASPEVIDKQLETSQKKIEDANFNKSVYYGEVISWCQPDEIEIGTGVHIVNWQYAIDLNNNGGGGGGSNGDQPVGCTFKSINNKAFKDQPKNSIHLYCAHAALGITDDSNGNNQNLSEKASEKIPNLLSWLDTDQAIKTFEKKLLENKDGNNGEEKDKPYESGVKTNFFEVNTFLTFVYKDKDDKIYVKTLKLKVAAPGRYKSSNPNAVDKTFNANLKINFPFVSASTEDPYSQYGTAFLGCIQVIKDNLPNSILQRNNDNTTFIIEENNIMQLVAEPPIESSTYQDAIKGNFTTDKLILKPYKDNQTIYSNCVTVGNLYFGDITLSCNAQTLDVTVHNFYIYCGDRAFAASNNIEDIVPYFYECYLNDKVIECRYRTMYECMVNTKREGDKVTIIKRSNSTPGSIPIEGETLRKGKQAENDPYYSWTSYSHVKVQNNSKVILDDCKYLAPKPDSGEWGLGLKQPEVTQDFQKYVDYYVDTIYGLRGFRQETFTIKLEEFKNGENK